MDELVGPTSFSARQPSTTNVLRSRCKLSFDILTDFIAVIGRFDDKRREVLLILFSQRPH